jgi:hypothetical protein
MVTDKKVFLMTAYSKSCPQTIRKFYDDFDLLPAEIKALIWDSPFMPGEDELKVAWQLAAEDSTLAALINKVNCLKPTAEELKARAEAERQRKKEQKHNGLLRRYTYKEPIYGKARLKDVDPKQNRLVMRVSEQQAAELALKRNENKDVKPASYYVRPVIGYTNVTINVKDDELRKPPTKDDKPQHILKILHNAGGKK